MGQFSQHGTCFHKKALSRPYQGFSLPMSLLGKDYVPINLMVAYKGLAPWHNSIVAVCLAIINIIPANVVEVDSACPIIVEAIV